MTATLTPALANAPRPRSAFPDLRVRRNLAVLNLSAAWLLVVGNALAATSGDFEYTDEGATITITGYTAGAPADVVIPDTIIGKPVSAIGASAFFNRTELTSVSFSASVTAIGTNAFLYCSGLTSAPLPPALTSIGDQAFASCIGLSALTVPTGVTVIGNKIFSGCSGLQSVTFQGDVTSIGDSAFLGCSGLQTITIPPNVTNIGTKAFQSCTGLTGVTIPSGVSAIKDYTFVGCTGLLSVTIPSTVASIGRQAFYNCTHLSSVTISESSPGLTSIGVQAFSNCLALTSVTIPATVTSIGDKAFYNCSNLAEAVFTGNAPTTMGLQVFDLAASGFTIYHLQGATGFDVPPWTDYALGVSASDPLADWLTSVGLPADSNLLSDDNGDGVNLLMAYALNLNPNLNQSANLPQPVFSESVMSLSYLEAADGVTYSVETSTDALIWTTAGVTMSELDVNHVRTATVPMTGPQRFMRLKVSN